MFENTMENVPELVENPTEVVVEKTTTEKNLDQIKSDNLAAMRKRFDEAERRTAEAERRATEAEKWRNESQISKFDPQELPDDPFDAEDDEYIQAKQYKSASKRTDEKLKKLEQTIAILQAEKATEKLADFNDIVTNDNLKVLSSLYPHDYKSLMSNPDFDSRSISAYNMMVRYGIADVKKEIKREEQIKAVEKKIQINTSRPASSAQAFVSSSPLSNASRYDADGRLNLSESDAIEINKRTRAKMGMY